ncbi:hypothetical protein PCIT_a1700 [Pseudoalteromonas citrea]|uniref:Uncharacterized protein n=1 Tax=Pseudoalteromonas citrea TaxID=43655 RepID=A0AAD4FTX4_9GAMM|nr:hypothetical protein PCIT_a1700 [Pseudoalteromonas citrea]
MLKQRLWLLLHKKNDQIAGGEIFTYHSFIPNILIKTTW